MAARCIGAATPQEARDRAGDLPRLGAKTVTKGKSMIGEEIGGQRLSRAERHDAGRNRSRRIHHPAPARDAEPHHRPGHPLVKEQVAETFRQQHTAPDARPAAGRGRGR